MLIYALESVLVATHACLRIQKRSSSICTNRAKREAVSEGSPILYNIALLRVVPETKTAEFANSVDLDEVAHNEHLI